MDIKAIIESIRSSNPSRHELFRLDDNTYVLARMVLLEDAPTFLMVRDGRGRRIVDPDEVVDEGSLRVMYAFPVFCHPGGWKILVGAATRGSLLSNILDLLEAAGTDEVVMRISRKGVGLDTHYTVFPAAVSSSPEELKRFQEAYSQAPPPPSKAQIEEVVKRVFRRSGGEQ